MYSKTSLIAYTNLLTYTNKIISINFKRFEEKILYSGQVNIETTSVKA